MIEGSRFDYNIKQYNPGTEIVQLCLYVWYFENKMPKIMNQQLKITRPQMENPLYISLSQGYNTLGIQPSIISIINHICILHTSYIMITT